MVTLHHHPLCPHSRFVRLALGEMAISPSLVEEKPWERDTRFLALDPAGETPVLVEGAQVVPGAMTIAEYLNETRGMGPGGLRLMPTDPSARVEVRRLCQWFHRKFFADVSEGVVAEKVYKRYMRADSGGGPPDMHVVRAARSNIRYHLAYIGWLTGSRTWLAGEQFGFADLAAAAHLSCVDYLGDVPWAEDEQAKDWYARVKQRPSFRVLLADRLPGMAPANHYAEAQF